MVATGVTSTIVDLHNANSDGEVEIKNQQILINDSDSDHELVDKSMTEYCS